MAVWMVARRIPEEPRLGPSDGRRAKVALKDASKQFRAVLSRWETAYSMENFYRRDHPHSSGATAKAVLQSCNGNKLL